MAETHLRREDMTTSSRQVTGHRVLGLALTAVVIAAAAVGIVQLQAGSSRFWASRQSASDRPRGDGPSYDAKEEVQLLRQEIAEMKQGVQLAQMTTAAAAKPDTNPAPPAAEPDDHSVEELRQNAELHLQNVAKQLDEAFRRETRDGRWATQTEQSVRESLGSISGGRLDSVTCAATMCRVVVASNDEPAQRKLADIVSAQEPFRNGTFYERNGLVTTMYAARDGQSLPEVAPSP